MGLLRGSDLFVVGGRYRRDVRRPHPDPSKWLGGPKENKVVGKDILPVPGGRFEDMLASASPYSYRR
jgi:hypothetical protein